MRYCFFFLSIAILFHGAWIQNLFAHTPLHEFKPVYINVLARGTHVAFPSMARLADGRYLLVYREGSRHVSRDGKLKMRIASADFLQWTPIQTLYDEPNVDERDPSITVLKDGTIHISYFTYEPESGSLTPPRFQVRELISKDHAKSFQVSPATEGPNNHAVTSSGIEMSENFVMHPIYDAAPARYQNGRWRHSPSRLAILGKSSDSNLWTKFPIPLPSFESVFLQEPAMTVLPNGSWLMHVRTEPSLGTPGALLQLKSISQGSTWENMGYLPYLGHAPDLLQLRNGPLISAFRWMVLPPTAEQKVAFIHSTNSGSQWSAPKIIESCGRSECGYPSLMQLDGNRFAVIYYTPGAKAIRMVIYEY